MIDKRNSMESNESFKTSIDLLLLGGVGGGEWLNLT